MTRPMEKGGAVYPPGRDFPFNVLLAALDVEMLGALAANLRQSKGQVVRQAIASMYLMVCEGQPTCSSGQACFMAHLHNVQGRVPHMSNAPSAGVTRLAGTELGERRG